VRDCGFEELSWTLSRRDSMKVARQFVSWNRPRNDPSVAESYEVIRTSPPELVINPWMVPAQNAVVNPGRALQVMGKTEEGPLAKSV
jgi:hypothetical protein